MMFKVATETLGVANLLRPPTYAATHTQHDVNHRRRRREAILALRLTKMTSLRDWLLTTARLSDDEADDTLCTLEI